MIKLNVKISDNEERKRTKKVKICSYKRDKIDKLLVTLIKQKNEII